MEKPCPVHGCAIKIPDRAFVCGWHWLQFPEAGRKKLGDNSVTDPTKEETRRGALGWIKNEAGKTLR